MPDNTVLVKLAAPFKKEEIKFRAGQVLKGQGKALALAYVDARVVQDRLDEVMGAENWQLTHACYPGKNDEVVCSVSLRINDEWITKSNGAGDTDFEEEKGSFSDAFKRAASMWGICRYLYDFTSIWVAFDETKKKFTADPWTCVKNPPAEGKNKTADNKPISTIGIAAPIKEDGTGTDWMAWGNLYVRALQDCKDQKEFLHIMNINKNLRENMRLQDKAVSDKISQISSNLYKKITGKSNG